MKNIKEIKKAKGNLITLTVKDVTKIKAGRTSEQRAKRDEMGDDQGS